MQGPEILILLPMAQEPEILILPLAREPEIQAPAPAWW